MLSFIPVCNKSHMFIFFSVQMKRSISQVVWEGGDMLYMKGMRELKSRSTQNRGICQNSTLVRACAHECTQSTRMIVLMLIFWLTHCQWNRCITLWFIIWCIIHQGHGFDSQGLYELINVFLQKHRKSLWIQLSTKCIKKHKNVYDYIMCCKLWKSLNCIAGLEKNSGCIVFD